MSDRVRQLAVTASAVFMVIGTLFGIGLIGTPVERSAGGSLSATATLLAPAGPAFSIWSVIYLGLIAFVVWQWLPANTAALRSRRIGWLAAASMVLNGGWLLVTQAGWLWASVAVIVALVLTLGVLMARLGQETATQPATKLIVEGTFGLYLGWVTVATVANLTATLVASGLNPAPGIAEVLAIAVLAVTAVIAVGIQRALDGQFGVAIAITWGLAWIAVGRLNTTPASPLTAVAAIVAALVVIVATGVLTGQHRTQPVVVHAGGERR